MRDKIMLPIDTEKRKKAKLGGANSSGDLGGIYEYPLDDRTVNTYLVKKEDDVSANIAEFLGSRVFGATAPGYGAVVELATQKDLALPNRTGENVYVASKYFGSESEPYLDMYKDIDRYTGSVKSFRKDGRPLFAGSLESLTGYLSKAFKQEKYQGFAKVAATSLLIGDFDIHTGNVGVVREQGKAPRLVRIDFGRAFDAFGANVNPESFMEHLPGLGPTNHFREFPVHLRQNKEFVEELREVSKKDMTKSINDSVDELARVYGPKALQEFMAKKLGMSKKELDQIEAQAKHLEDKGGDKAEIIKNVLKTQLLSRISARQKCLENYANELTARGLYVQNEKGEWVKDRESKIVAGLTASKPESRSSVMFAARKRVGKFFGSGKGGRS